MPLALCEPFALGRQVLTSRGRAEWRSYALTAPRPIPSYALRESRSSHRRDPSPTTLRRAQRSHLTKTGGSPGTDDRKCSRNAVQDRRALMVS